MKIVLFGYMASGKSFLGEKLAKIIGYSFQDLDAFIEKKEGKSIFEIFSSKGEIYFRKKETAYLQELIAQPGDAVISLGGGTPCYGNNLNLLLNNPTIKTIYLKVSIPNLVDRLLVEPNIRPLISHLKTKEDLQEYIGKHLFERSAYYSQAAFIVDANQDQKEILDAILKLLV
ncbi:shikimate kinase [Oceanihabitans sediminis]|uniref:Shikimate kinase n=1 Tax=Oceanihabitans sediminis TaxID=1812012 RepID=A0A368P499_9FLAO|nr:shikimate kinase [Oceanihabitans sediminis]RBP30764.1 shikimate kinase [Oceanihabitans sediminis]RCU56735.1 shikimate kinase [Oceanihabitans sediminis]